MEMPTTVAERNQKAMLVKAALAEVLEHVPAVQFTRREMEQIHELAGLIRRWISEAAMDKPATFNLGCYFLGVDASEVRRALRI
jgi:hypothetical protein